MVTLAKIRDNKIKEDEDISQDKFDVIYLKNKLFSKYHFKYFAELESTNSYLKNHQGQDREVIIADYQSKGRGKSSKSFYSPKAKGLYFSLLLKNNFALTEINKLTAVVAVCVKNALDDLYQIDSSIKWVNDLYYLDKKLAGILIEANLATKDQTVESLIIGIGINVFASDVKELADHAASLEALTAKRISRNQICLKILTNIDYALGDLNNPYYLEVYRSSCYLKNKSFNLKVDNRVLRVKYVGIDGNFALIVSQDGQVFKVSHGEINFDNYD